MDLYLAKHVSYAQDVAANPFVNVYAYVVDGFGAEVSVAQSIAEWLKDNLILGTGGWVDIVQIGMDSDYIEVTSPFDDSVLWLEDATGVGTRTGGQMPNFVAWGFKSERTRADIRAGFKRYGVISESDTAGQVPTAGMLTVLNTFANLMQTTFPVTGTLGTYAAVPVIVKRIPYETESGNTAYRMPTNAAELVVSQAINWEFQGITSQNSRKR